MIDPTVSAVLRSKYTKRRFFGIYILVLLLLVVSLLALPSIFKPDSVVRDVLANVLGNFAATVAVFLVTYAFYVYVTPEGLRNATVVPLRSPEIADEIVNLQTEVTDYWFWGRSGTYFRNVVLPKLDASAKKERRQVYIRVVLPDYSNPALCERYAKLREGLDERASRNTLPANVIATLYRLACMASGNPYLHIQVGLCTSLPVLRFDLSNGGGLVTRDAKELPALLVNAGNPYFDMLKDAVENELDQAVKVQLLDFGQGARTLSDFCSQQHLASVSEGVLAEAEEVLSSSGHRYGR